MICSKFSIENFLEFLSVLMIYNSIADNSFLEVFMSLLDFDTAIKINPPYMIFMPFNSQKKLTILTHDSDPIPTIPRRSFENKIMIPVCCLCTRSLFKHTIITFRPSMIPDTRPLSHQLNNFCCVGCFSKQVMKKSQEKQQNIKYNVYAKLEYPILSGNWSVFYQFIMLDSLEVLGFDWEQCEQYLRYMGASFRTEQIMNHYEAYYSNTNKQLQIDTIFINKRKEKSTISLITQRNPYTLSQMSSHSSENSQLMNGEEALHCYQQTATNLVIRSQCPCLQQYIADFQFYEKTQPASQKQFQLKYRILEEYNKLVKVRQQKKEMIVRYQQIILGPPVFQERLTSLVSGTIKNLIDIYCDFCPERREDEKLFQMLGSALSISKSLMRFLSKDQFLVLTDSIHFCLKIHRLCETLEKYEKPKNKNKSKKFGLFNCLRKLKQQDEAEQQKPRKRRKLEDERADEKADEKTKKIIKSLGFQNEESFIKYLHSNDGKNDESPAQLILMKFNN